MSPTSPQQAGNFRVYGEVTGKRRLYLTDFGHKASVNSSRWEAYNDVIIINNGLRQIDAYIRTQQYFVPIDLKRLFGEVAP